MTRLITFTWLKRPVSDENTVFLGILSHMDAFFYLKVMKNILFSIFKLTLPRKESENYGGQRRGRTNLDNGRPAGTFAGADDGKPR
jgi:hypothetical protein